MEDKMFNDIIDSIINNASDDEIEIIREKIHALLLVLCLDSSCCIADKQDFCLAMRKYIAGIL